MHLSESVYYTVQSCAMAHKLWETLLSTYEKKAIATKIYLIQCLYNLPMRTSKWICFPNARPSKMSSALLFCWVVCLLHERHSSQLSTTHRQRLWLMLPQPGPLFLKMLGASHLSRIHLVKPRLFRIPTINTTIEEDPPEAGVPCEIITSPMTTSHAIIARSLGTSILIVRLLKWITRWMSELDKTSTDPKRLTIVVWPLRQSGSLQRLRIFSW